MKLIAFILFTIISINVRGQVYIFNQNLTDISINIFYIGVDNRISILWLADYKIAISGGGGTIQKTGKDQYVVRVTTPTDNCEIIITNGTKNIFRQSYFVRTIGDPVATLSGIRDTIVSKNRILLNPFLTVVIPNCYYNHNRRVLSFSATFINDRDSVPTITNGNLLSQDQLKLVKEANTGSKIYFDNIRAIGPDERARKLFPFWIKIQ